MCLLRQYQPGTNLYERREDKKKRAPAWCDRIQWIGDDITQLCYTRCETLKISDHKPVSAMFEIGAQQVVQDKKRTVYDSLIRQLDSWENQAIPKVEIRPPQIELGDQVRFDEPVRRTLTIENIGAVTVVEFHFVPKLSTGLDHATSAAGVRSGLQAGQCGKSWLRITPEMGIIPPGESLDITIEACINASCAHAVQTGAEPLEDILILALENGRDYFVPVQGTYVKSCFGSTIEYLVNVSAGGRCHVQAAMCMPTIATLSSFVFFLLSCAAFRLLPPFAPAFRRARPVKCCRCRKRFGA
jgi:phosphatidylinositol-bisphosphatase